MTFKITACTDAPHTVNPVPGTGVTMYPERATTMWAVDAHSPWFATAAEAERIASQFPKFVKARTTRLSHGDGRYEYGVWFNARFGADDVNKGKNETGLKRLRALLKIVAWEYDATVYGNSATTAQFERFVETGSIR